MRNVFLFLRRYSIFLRFLVMQVIALIMLFSKNRFHQSYLGMVSKELAGAINTRVNAVESFFSLSQQNDALREQNAELLSLLPSGSVWADSTGLLVQDTAWSDSVRTLRQFVYLPAKVISNSVFLPQNHVILHRGSDQGIEPNMAVVSRDGIIGTVVHVSKNMSGVMSLLNNESIVIAMLKKGSGLGEISWDGNDPYALTLSKIPKTVKVALGDTVVTSPYSDRFPPGSKIGKVVEVDQDQETNTYILTVRPFVDFNTVQHAFVVRNVLENEMDAIRKKFKKE
ncbi:MAG: rod shape-determining protein MreC [Bacteroidetes bacterium]|nr:rod shape-determining protein MreC [Bacteroidota bacterium]